MVYGIRNYIHNGNPGKCIHFKDKVRFLNQAAIDREIYSGVITLKNLAIVNRTRPLAAEYILEVLMENSNKLKKEYQLALSAYRTGEREECFKRFAQNTGTKSGKSFAAILAKLDVVNPVELLEQLEVFQNMMMEIRITEEMKAVERRSVIGTVISTAAIFAILIDFVVVGVFLDTLSMLQHMF